MTKLVQSEEEDRISALPDDIIESIVSHLDIKAALRISVVSQGWRYKWTHLQNLEFDASEKQRKDLRNDRRLIGIERIRYINWVSYVMKKHSSPSIEKFRACFDIGVEHASDIDSWVQLAFSKQVQVLELNFHHNLREFSRYYSFGCDILRDLPDSCFYLLKSLHLESVSISEKSLEFIISKCVLLEKLTLDGTHFSSSLRVCGPSSKLKYLELRHCSGVVKIDICAPNLVSIIFNGKEGDITCYDVPSLVEVSVNSYSPWISGPGVLFFSSLSSQLKRLSLELHKVGANYITCPTLANVEELELMLYPNDMETLLVVVAVSFLKACPLLKKFKLEVCRFFQRLVPKEELERYERPNMCTLGSLREVELVRFDGPGFYRQLATYVIENSVSLEKITFDARWPLLFQGGPTSRLSQVARSHARKLATKLPRGAKICIM